MNMPADLIFYTNPLSRGGIVRWMLEEVGAPYQTVVVDYGPPMKAPDYLAVNPMGKVPALRHGETVVTECAAICAYLADSFPDAALAPPPGLRGAYYRWLFFGAGPLEAAMTNHALNVTVPQAQLGMVGYGSLALVMDVLDQQLSDAAYLAGERFTAADVYTGSQIVWGMHFGAIAPRHTFSAYVDRLSARPAFARARALDDALTPAKA